MYSNCWCLINLIIIDPLRHIRAIGYSLLSNASKGRFTILTIQVLVQHWHDDVLLQHHHIVLGLPMVC